MSRKRRSYLLFNLPSEFIMNEIQNDVRLRLLFFLRQKLSPGNLLLNSQGHAAKVHKTISTKLVIIVINNVPYLGLRHVLAKINHHCTYMYYTSLMRCLTNTKLIPQYLIDMLKINLYIFDIKSINWFKQCIKINTKHS